MNIPFMDNDKVLVYLDFMTLSGKSFMALMNIKSLKCMYVNFVKL